MLELTNLLPQILSKYTFAFTPRGSRSPHKYPGIDEYGKFNDEEPWHLTSSWFRVQKDFWLDVRSRS